MKDKKVIQSDYHSEKQRLIDEINACMDLDVLYTMVNASSARYRELEVWQRSKLIKPLVTYIQDFIERYGDLYLGNSVQAKLSDVVQALCDTPKLQNRFICPYQIGDTVYCIDDAVPDFPHIREEIIESIKYDADSFTVYTKYYHYPAYSVFPNKEAAEKALKEEGVCRK